MRKIKPLKIALIGTYPPPYGGRSVHIKRLKEQLDKRGIETVVYNIGGDVDIPEKNLFKIGRNPFKMRNMRKLIIQCLPLRKEDIIHFHGSGWRERAIVGLIGFLGGKTVISLHSSFHLKDAVEQGSWFKRLIIRFALKHTSFIIADNEKIENLVLSLGVKQQNVACVSAFIPPTIKEGDYKEVPQYVWDFIISHTPVISANAFAIDFYNGIDLYGLDMVVELTAKLKGKYPEVGVVFCLPSIGDKEYFEKLNREIKERELNKCILFITEPLEEVYPIWQASNVFVRPTVTDGDALSVREALFFKIPTVASDVVPRPEGTVLFKNRDVEDFIARVKMVWDKYGHYKSKIESIEVENGLGEILEVYNRLANNRG